MPTYSYRCATCDGARDVFQGIRAYSLAPDVPQCCGQAMARHLVPGSAPVFVGEAHYAGMRASDGTDISSRAKHRAYMREHNLTTMDDFNGQWQRQARERQERLQGDDTTRRADIAAAVEQLQARGK